jgi:hypothetical protein
MQVQQREKFVTIVSQSCTKEDRFHFLPLQRLALKDDGFDDVALLNIPHSILQSRDFNATLIKALSAGASSSNLPALDHLHCRPAISWIISFEFGKTFHVLPFIVGRFRRYRHPPSNGLKRSLYSHRAHPSPRKTDSFQSR